MALDKEYFDSISIEVVKKKYYNANKVHAVFEDIRRQAEALIRENEVLRSANLDLARDVGNLRRNSDSKEDIADAIISSRIIAQTMIRDAEEEAAEIIRKAEQQRDEMLRDAQAKQEYALRRVERAFNNMREQQLACMEALNAEWQDYLCGLDDYAPAEEEEREVETAPQDLREKVSALADFIESLGSSDDDA